MSDRMSDVDRLVYICGKILFMAEISAVGLDFFALAKISLKDGSLSFCTGEIATLCIAYAAVAGSLYAGHCLFAGMLDLGIFLTIDLRNVVTIGVYPF